MSSSLCRHKAVQKNSSIVAHEVCVYQLKSFFRKKKHVASIRDNKKHVNKQKLQKQRTN